MSHRGYTLVELLIIITITGILMTFIFSGYTKSQERQTVQQIKEQLLSSLQSYQKSAYIGNKDCTGELTGVTVSFTATTITGTPQCSSGLPGTPSTVNLNHMQFSPVPPSFTFKPLNQGIIFQTGTSLDLRYIISGNVYSIKVENPGIITYQGLVP